MKTVSLTRRPLLLGPFKGSIPLRLNSIKVQETTGKFCDFQAPKRNAENFMLSDICRIHFHIRSNAGIMASNRDLVNQSES